MHINYFFVLKAKVPKDSDYKDGKSVIYRAKQNFESTQKAKYCYFDLIWGEGYAGL